MGNMGTEAEGNENIPFELRPWLYLYRKVPNLVNAPFSDGKVGLTFAIVSTGFFLICQVLTQAALTSLGWPYGDLYKYAVSSIPPIIHSCLILPGLWGCLRTHKFDPSAKMESSPQWWQEGVHALMQFCTGYMIYDAINCIFFLYWSPGQGFVPSGANLSFLGHHFATSIYMLSTRTVGAGHYSAMILMFTGEFTNPFQNSRTVLVQELEQQCCLHDFVTMIFPYVDLMFGVGYTFFRVIVGPGCALLITYDLLLTKRGRSNVHWGLSSVWCLLMWAVLIGSIPWIYESADIISKYMNEGMSPEL